MRRRNFQDCLRQIVRVLLTGAVLGMLVVAPGCGGGSSSTTPPPPPPASTTTLFRIGDVPVDRVISFELTFTSPVVLTTTAGQAMSLTLAQNRFELSHMSADLEPLAITSVPQGSYGSIAFTITNPEVIFLDDTGTSHTISSTATQTVTIILNPPLTIGTTPGVVSVDLNMANSLSFDASGNVTGFNFSSSSFAITSKAIAAENQQEDDNGSLEDVTGLVTTVSGSNFHIKVGQSGADLTFSTDSTTQFSDGLINVASAFNQIVKVEGVTKSDGTLFAKEVEGLESQSGAELEGLITSVSGNPATSLSLLVQDGAGSGMDGTQLGQNFTVDLTGLQASAYTVDQGAVDFSGLSTVGGSSLNFPFDPTTIHAGQRVEVESASALPASGLVVADGIKLRQQTVRGVVTSIVSISVPRTLAFSAAADSAFSIQMGGNPIVTVWQQAGTDVRTPNQAIEVTDTLRVRGLMFCRGLGCNLIARRITP
jgi:Domain of unknown function (DUF5666)